MGHFRHPTGCSTFKTTFFYYTPTSVEHHKSRKPIPPPGPVAGYEPNRRAVLFLRVSSDKQDVARQLDMLQTSAAAQGWQVVATLKATVSGSKKMNSARPEVQELLRLIGEHQVQLVAVEQVSRLSRIRSQSFEIFEAATAAGVSIWIERYHLETLLPDGRLNPGADRIFSDQAHEAHREVLEHAERVTSGILYARSKRPDRQWGRPAGSKESDAELVAKPRHRDLVRRIKAGGSVRDVAKLCEVSTRTVRLVRQALMRLQEAEAPKARQETT